MLSSNWQHRFETHQRILTSQENLRQDIASVKDELNNNTVQTVKTGLCVPRNFNTLSLQEHITLFPESSETILALTKFLPKLRTMSGSEFDPKSVVIAPRKSFSFGGVKYHASWTKRKFSYLTKDDKMIRLMLIFSVGANAEIHAFGRILEIQPQTVLTVFPLPRFHFSNNYKIWHLNASMDLKPAQMVNDLRYPADNVLFLDEFLFSTTITLPNPTSIPWSQPKPSDFSDLLDDENNE